MRPFRRHAPPPAPPAPDPLLAHADPADRAIVERAMPYSMTGAARLLALVDAVRHLVDRGVPGAFAECGVWRGGSVLAMLLTLRELGADDRDVFLYDTFTGMTKPTAADTSPLHAPALQDWEASGGRPYPELFASGGSGEAEVRALLEATGYPAARLHLVAGPVEETLPARSPGPLALLRLDTDWHESTKHELTHLYPLLAPGGVLVVDDYGHWEGARRAVDEHFAAHPPRPLLTRVDYTCRIGVRP